MGHTIQLVCSMEECVCVCVSVSEMIVGPQLVGSYLTSCRTSIHSYPLPIPILSVMNAFHAVPYNFFMIHFNIIVLSTP